MELNQLKAFVTVAEEGHLTRAADRLFTSQPAISAKLKSLEETLGVALFDRTPKGMSLTPAGERLLIQAKAILEASNQMLADATSIQGTIVGQLSIGINSDLSFLKLPELLADTSEHYPDLQLSFVNGMSPDNITHVRKGKLDAGFFFGPCASLDVHTIHLADIPTAVVAPAGWGDQVTYASVEDLANLPWIYTTNRCPFYKLKEAILSDAGLEPSKTVFVDSEEAIRELVKAESGIALLRKDDAEKAEQEGWGTQWKGRTPTIPLGVAISPKRMQDPLIQAWLEQLSKFWPMNDTGKQQNAG
ncbi:LysR family transcriptional regulator [Litoribacillus peritrichatus]|uniref:LysR family transcriptional regulator n=1 Tax=Litoribacillus peritrichatus TaxID=718191 RepID=A0ABP7MDB5_9GAMM